MRNSINKLIEEKLIYDKMFQEVENLEGTQKNIQTLFGILKKEKDKTFLYLQRFKIYELFNAIVTFTLNNPNFFKNNNGIEVKIFFVFLQYLYKRKYTGTLEGFEYYLKNNYKNQNEELLFFIGTPTFYNQIVNTVNSKIDNLIEELMEDILKIEGIKQEIPKSKELHFDEELLEELEDNKKQEIVTIYGEIISILLGTHNEDSKIIEILYQNKLIEKSEKLYNFFQEHKSFIEKIPNGTKIYELVFYINSEEIYKKTFSQLLQQLDIKGLNLLLFSLDYT